MQVSTLMEPLGLGGNSYGSGIPTWKLVIVSPTLFFKRKKI
jgi:hypothetical protein